MVFVTEFRRQYELLPNEAKRRLSSLDDFRSPCQILVFWASEPDYQDILVVREPKLTGDSIKVYGPAPPEMMVTEADSMLKDRWFESSPEPARSSLEQVYKAMVQDWLLGIIRVLPQARLSLAPRDGKGVPIIKRGSVESALLLGIPCTAVRDEDLGEAKFYDNGDWGEYSNDLGKRRTRSLEMEMSPIKEEEFSGFKLLSETDFKSTVARAEEATSIPEQSDYSRWYIDAYTYQIDGSYDQAVVKSWLIIEQHIKSMFATLAPKGALPRKILPSNDAMLKKLLKAGKISTDQYKDLDSLRSKRNEIIHRGSVTTGGESREFLEVAERLTRAITGILKPIY